MCFFSQTITGFPADVRGICACLRENLRTPVENLYYGGRYLSFYKKRKDRQALRGHFFSLEGLKDAEKCKGKSAIKADLKKDGKKEGGN